MQTCVISEEGGQVKDLVLPDESGQATGWVTPDWTGSAMALAISAKIALVNPRGGMQEMPGHERVSVRQSAKWHATVHSVQQVWC